MIECISKRWKLRAFLRSVLRSIFRLHPKSLFAVEISNTALIYIEMTRKRGSRGSEYRSEDRDEYRLDRAFIETVPLNDSLSTPDRFLGILEKSWGGESGERGSPGDCRVGVLGLPGALVTARSAPLEGNGEDIQEQIAGIYDEVIPYVFEESYYDYVELDDSKKMCEPHASRHGREYIKTKKPRHILIVATLRKHIRDWEALFSRCDRRLEMVSVSSFGLERALEFISEPCQSVGLKVSREGIHSEIKKDLEQTQSKTEVIALLELNQERTTVFLFQNKRFIFNRDFPSCIEYKTWEAKQAFCDQINLILNNFCFSRENRDLDIRVDKLGSGNSNGNGSGNSNSIGIGQWFLSGETELIDEMQICIEKVLTETNAPVIANPFEKLHFSEKISEDNRKMLLMQAPRFMACVGLLLSAFDNRQNIESKRCINLLPWREEKRRKRNTFFLGCLIVSVLFSCILIGAVWSFLKYRHGNVDAELTNLIDQKKLFSAKIKEIEAFKKDRQTLLRSQAVIKTLPLDSTKRSLWFLQTLPSLLPEGLSLNSLVGKDNKILLEGNAKTHCAVAAFLKNLAGYENRDQEQSEDQDQDQSQYVFKEIKLTEIISDKQGLGLKFKLQFTILSLREKQSSLGNVG